MSTAIITPGVSEAMTPSHSVASRDALADGLSPALQQQLAWQAQLLSAMGVERWVSQSSPVMTVDKGLWDTPLAANLESDQVAPILGQQSVSAANDSMLVQPPAPPSIDALVGAAVVMPQLLSPSAPVTETRPVAHGQAVGRHGETTHADIDLAATIDADRMVVPRFGLQAIRVANWVLVVDSQALHQDTRYQQLWQQITTNLRQTPAYFDFPLCDNEANLPTAVLHTMASHKMAWASLQGFLYGLTHEHGVEANPPATPRLGALTPLPECLDMLTFERLPFINEMVEDYRLKRQLWRLLTQV